MRASASASVASGKMVIGSTTMPLSKRLTLRTSSAWSAGSRLRWMTPMPPACAMAMASRASVTVSIAEETIGRFSRIVRVRREAMLTPLGMTALRPGRSSTSSNASPSGKPVSTFAIRRHPSSDSRPEDRPYGAAA